MLTKTVPKKWSKDEEERLLEAKHKGLSNIEIGELLDRSEVSIQIKLKRLTKRSNTYNAAHVLDKYETNKLFVEELMPKTVLDVYCGINSFYKTNYPEIKVVTNDIKKDIEADYHMDALRFLCTQYSEGKRYDFIDLDPFGSAFECFALAIRMAKKGIAVTFGEIGHKRWKRLDYVSRVYGIQSMGGFTSGALIAGLQKVALQNKKKLSVVHLKEWRNITRVYCTLEDMKITVKSEKDVESNEQ